MMARVLEHLGALVACDTRNPPRDIDGQHPIFGVLDAVLQSSFEVEVADHGAGRVSYFARRGRPDVLFNVHLDTVPVGEGWRYPPLALTVEGDRAYGRGTCDIKGAAAALLAIAESTDHDLALLFTTDEEGASGCCVREFCKAHDLTGYDAAVVAEPTNCRAVTAHRGFLSVVGRFSGRSGHSSEPYALTDSAVHRFSRWSAAALAAVAGESAADRSCFNIGRVEGGIKSNVIADALEVRWSARLPGGHSNAAFMARITGLTDGRDAEWTCPFEGPPLPGTGADEASARAFAERHRLPAGDPVSFWTEASLFSAAGLPAIVLGPGDIAQAHTIDEWVTLAQLQRAHALYLGIAS